MTRPKADLPQGALDMLILKALSIGPLHGYGVIQRIRRLSDELLEVEQCSECAAREERCDRLALAIAKVRKAVQGG